MTILGRGVGICVAALRFNGNQLITTLPSTPSDVRSSTNAIKLLAKAGFVN